MVHRVVRRAVGARVVVDVDDAVGILPDLTGETDVGIVARHQDVLGQEPVHALHLHGEAGDDHAIFGDHHIEFGRLGVRVS